MSSTTSLRIDTAIQSTSYLRWLLYLMLSTVMVILAWLAALAWWQYVFILIVAAAVVLYLSLSRPILLHLSQPPLSQPMEQYWQLLMRTGRGNALWQAQLQAVHRLQWAMSLEFVVTEPYQRVLTVAIFRDQVTPEQWRELSILANMSGNHSA